jgi:hypothetical protein
VQITTGNAKASHWTHFLATLFHLVSSHLVSMATCWLWYSCECGNVFRALSFRGGICIRWTFHTIRGSLWNLLSLSMPSGGDDRATPFYPDHTVSCFTIIMYCAVVLTACLTSLFTINSDYVMFLLSMWTVTLVFVFSVRIRNWGTLGCPCP